MDPCLTVRRRYPTFTLALQDLQDPLNLVHLFSTLPTNPIPGKTLVPSEVIQECSRLISEWKVRRLLQPILSAALT